MLICDLCRQNEPSIRIVVVATDPTTQLRIATCLPDHNIDVCARCLQTVKDQWPELKSFLFDTLPTEGTPEGF